MVKKRKSALRKAPRGRKKRQNPQKMDKFKPDDDLLALRNQVLQQRAEKAKIQKERRDKAKLEAEKKKLTKESKRLIKEKTTVGAAKRNLARIKVPLKVKKPTTKQVKKAFFRF